MLRHSLALSASQPLTRRQFLKIALATTASIGLSASVLAENKPNAPKAVSGTPTVIIVGGGLGGLVTAYSFMKQGIPCELYEATLRLGGRTFTKRGFNREGMFCELGGELIDTSHAEIIALCKELRIPLEQFASGDAGLVESLYFSEGRLRSEEDVIAAFAPLAEKLRTDLRQLFPNGEVLIPTYQQPGNARDFDRMTLAAYLDSVSGLAPWLKKLLEIAYAGEYGLDPSEQSALNLLLLIDAETADGFRIFGDSDEAMRIKGGSGRLADTLVQAIKSKVPIRTGQALNGISDDAGQVRLTFRHGDRESVVKSERVVLALPFSVLRTIPGVEALKLSAVKQRAIREWGYGTNSKQMIGFTSRFWREKGKPIPANTGSLFTDWTSQCYWETSRLQPGKSGILTNFLGGEAGSLADASQWQKALRDLEVLYPGISNRTDGRTAFFNWHRFPYAQGSYTCPKPGQYTEIIGAAHEPELDRRLFFAGEHCSVDWMGFMNGAVQSGLLAASQVADTLPACIYSAF
jgi:monoamine oxidase